MLEKILLANHKACQLSEMSDLDTAAGPIGQVAALGGIVHLSCMMQNFVFMDGFFVETETHCC